MAVGSIYRLFHQIQLTAIIPATSGYHELCCRLTDNTVRTVIAVISTSVRDGFGYIVTHYITNLPPMANLVRTAKSGSEWTGNELLAFNIRVVDNIAAFFNTTQLPATQVSETILNNLEKPNQPLPKDDRLFFRYLGLVEKPQSPESHADDFAAFILRILNYDDQDRIICQNRSFPLLWLGSVSMPKVICA
jgi:hypothetical protein